MLNMWYDASGFEVYGMGTKEMLLSLLEENKGVYFSGEEIANTLSVSRTAVWKAIRTLRERGYTIDAVPNRGYCLSVGTDILSPQGIRKHLSDRCGALTLEVLPTADSTKRKKSELFPCGGWVRIFCLYQGYFLLNLCQQHRLRIEAAGGYFLSELMQFTYCDMA